MRSDRADRPDPDLRRPVSVSVPSPRIPAAVRTFTGLAVVRTDLVTSR